MGCILVTGFEPFGGEKINPSWLAAERLPAVVAGRPVEKLLLPVEFGASARLLCRRLEQLAAIAGSFLEECAPAG